MKNAAVIGALVVLCCVAVAVALSAGPTGWRAPWELFRSGEELLLSLRGPRVALAALVGASLALAGLAMQALLGNELADPYVLGMSGGAAAAAVTSLYVAAAAPPGPAAALGAAGAAYTVRALTRGRFDPSRLVLSGVAVGAVLASLTGLLIVLAPPGQLLRSATFWLFGGLGRPSAPLLLSQAVLLGLGLAWLSARASRLDRLMLGEDTATALGVNVPRVRREAMVVAVALTATSVAAGGLVGFVGLIAPHGARRLVGVSHRWSLPVTAMLGGLLLLLADTAARTAFAPREVPVGLLTALVGGPFFLYLLHRSQR